MFMKGRGGGSGACESQVHKHPVATEDVGAIIIKKIW